MNKKVLSIFFTLILVLTVCLATAVPAMASDTTDREDAAIAAADRLVELQNADGGFPWIIPGEGASASNCLGVTAWGILKAYEIDPKLDYETSLAYAYMYIVNTPPDYIWAVDRVTKSLKYTEIPEGDDSRRGVDSYPDFTFMAWLADAAEDSPGLLAAIQLKVDGTTPTGIRALAKTRWDTRTLYLGSTQEVEPNGTATGLAEYIRDIRHNQNYDALIPWDLELGVEAALAMDDAYPGQGYRQQANDINDVIYAAIDDTEGEEDSCLYFDSGDNTQKCYVLGLTGAVKADVETGLYYQTESGGLLTSLLNEQQGNGHWISELDEGDVQATAYAIMALFAEGSEDAIDAANAGAVWLVTSQNTNGGWFANGDEGDEYAEIDGEAGRALVLAAGGTTTDTTVNIPEIVAISVTPTSIDFGTLYPGQSSADKAINVDNIGTVEVDVRAELVNPDTTVFDNLNLDGSMIPKDLIGGLEVGGNKNVIARLVVPANYSAKGTETNQIVFEVTAAE